MDKIPLKEHQLLAMLALNGAGNAVGQIVSNWQPRLNELLIITQIMVALSTVWWIFRRSKTAKLER